MKRERSKQRPARKPARARPHPKARGGATAGETGSSDSLEAAIGQGVREFRKDARLGIVELARRARLSPGMLSKIENGAISPSLATLRSLARALQVPVTSLFREFEEVRDTTFVRAGQGLLVSRDGPRIGHEYRILGHTTSKRIARRTLPHEL